MKLKVAESRPRDVGRGIARIDPEAMKNLAAVSGDIIRITGNRSGFARVMPTFPEDRGKGLVAIDGIIRGNADVPINTDADIKKADLPVANMVVLQPIEEFRQKKIDGRLLEGRPVQKDDRIRLNLFGGRYNFTVHEINPKEGIIGPETIIKVKGAPVKGPEVRHGLISYEDIGGVKPQLEKIREMIELPLRYPELFERVGIDPPKGVLLYGPPGTGKTLIAKAVANEVKAHFIYVSGPEVIGKYYGESEGRLREIFAEAETNAPAIIFIDEIDGIAPKREDVGGDKQVERRTVAQLLSLMDGLNQRGQVIVIAATNMPDLLDPALRRPGRFDRELEISIPDREGRQEILEIHTRGMPIDEGVDLSEVARITHGYVGADLAALCREAAMHVLREALPEIDQTQDYIPYEVLSGLVVGSEDFDKAFMEVQPSALREVYVEIPNVSWDDVGGLTEVKEKIQDAIELPLTRPDLFKYADVKPPTGIMLHGSPGTGKTLIARALANEVQANFISVKGPQLLSRYVGESERGVREIFRKARSAAPCILFFDEIDSIAPIRGSGGDSGVPERVIAQLLTEMDGLEELKGVIVLAATNRVDIVDPALMRPGRFDYVIELPLPDEAARLEIFRVHTRHKPVEDGFSPEGLVDVTKGFTGAEIESVCNKAALLAIKEFYVRSEKIEAERKAEEERLKLEEENKKKELEAKGREYEKIEALLATKDGQNEIDKKVIPSKDIKTFSVKKDHFTKVVEEIKKNAIQDDYNIKDGKKKSEEFSDAEIELICERAALYVIKEICHRCKDISELS